MLGYAYILILKAQVPPVRLSMVSSAPTLIFKHELTWGGEEEGRGTCQTEH